MGVVTTDSSKFVVATKDTSSVNAATSEVVAVRDDDEQKTYDATVEQLRNPGLADLWTSQLDTGLASLTRGNSASLTYTLAAKARPRKHARQNHRQYDGRLQRQR